MEAGNWVLTNQSSNLICLGEQSEIYLHLETIFLNSVVNRRYN